MNALAHMQALYARSDDPWGVARRWYERRKRALLLASLPAEHYGRAFEPACGTGRLTRELAERCDRLLASDGAPAAVRIAQRATLGCAGVEVALQRLPHEWPAGPFDLVVLSEWLYYLEPALVRVAAARCVASLAPGGTLLACHYRPPFDDRACATGFAHARLAEALQGLPPAVHHEEDDFLLDVWIAPARRTEAAA